MESVSSARRLRGKLLSTREGTIALGVGAAALAGLIVFVYVKQYRASLTEGAAPVNVLVARNLIESGTPGDIVGQKEQFQIAEVPRDELKVGALQDPAALQGRYAVRDVIPGEQLTIEAFGGLTGGALGTTLVDAERAIAVPVEGPRTGAGTVQAGDRVDILVAMDTEGAPTIRTLLRDVIVITPPGVAAGGAGIGGAGGGGGSAAMLKVDSPQAARLAWASEHGRLWLILRPRTGATNTPPVVVTADTIVRGR